MPIMGVKAMTWLRAAPLAGLALASCGGSSSKPASAPQIRIQVSSAPDANDKRPCYLVVRAVDAKAYVGDTYQAVAAMVMVPDDTVLSSTLVFPGTPVDLSLPTPQKGQVAVYVLFTYPKGDWKALLPSPSPSGVEITLAQSRMTVSAR